MRCRVLLALAMLALGAAGCLPVPSLYPLVEEGSGIAVPEAVGDWADSTTVLRIALERGTLYTMSNPDSGEASPRFRVQFARLGGRLFADVVPDPGSFPGGDQKPFLWPMHMVFRFDVSGDSLRMAFLDDEWMKRALNGREAKAHHERPNDEIVLTERSPGLQAMVRRLANVDAAFDTSAKFLRRR